MASVSVIVPVYRVEKYIHRCVDSILEQTFRDFELILVDDGSPDSCGAICDEYAVKDSRVVVIHRENGGLSAARNTGIDWVLGNSSSRWLTFVDSDDMIEPAFLERLLLAATSHGADIAACRLKIFRDDKLITAQEKDELTECVFSGREACMRLYKRDEAISVEACLKLYRRELFLTIRYPEGKIHEDQATTPLLLYAAQCVATIPDRLYCYYQRDDSIMGAAFSVKRFDDLDAINGCIQFFAERKETEIVRLAECRRALLWGLYILYAHKARLLKKVPKRYRISIRKAVNTMERSATFDQVTWFMAKVYPKWVKPYSYWIKLKQILNIN